MVDPSNLGLASPRTTGRALVQAIAQSWISTSSGSGSRRKTSPPSRREAATRKAEAQAGGLKPAAGWHATLASASSSKAWNCQRATWIGCSERSRPQGWAVMTTWLVDRNWGTELAEGRRPHSASLCCSSRRDPRFTIASIADAKRNLEEGVASGLGGRAAPGSSTGACRRWASVSRFRQNATAATLLLHQ
jgi:hypothetical protein